MHIGLRSHRADEMLRSSAEILTPSSTSPGNFYDFCCPDDQDSSVLCGGAGQAPGQARCHLALQGRTFHFPAEPEMASHGGVSTAAELVPAPQQHLASKGPCALCRMSGFLLCDGQPGTGQHFFF